MAERKHRGASTEVTLTVAVTAHSEGRLLRPTLRSVAAAIGALAESSITSELLIVIDNATDETIQEAEHWINSGRVSVPVRIIRLSVGDAAASRNAAAANANGEFLALCDGDDLVSRNYFTEALRLLLDAAGPLIVHPEVVISFGARSAIWDVPGTESVDYGDLLRHNLWPSSSVSQRATYLSTPYAVLDPAVGFGPEDWLWNIETAIAGIPHRPAPGTMFFYRVREFGGVNNRHLSSVLPPFDLDGLVLALPAADKIAHPVVRRRMDVRGTAQEIARKGFRAARPAIRLVTHRLSQETQEQLYGRARRLYRRFSPAPKAPARVVTIMLEAAELEPALTWTANGYGSIPPWIPQRDAYAALLISLVEQLRGKADALVAVPWVGIGGADLVSRNYARALVEDERFSGRVSILATYTASRTLVDLIPEGVNFVQVPESFRTLTPDLQRRLLAQVLLLVGPKLILSVNCFDVTNSLQYYGPQLGSSSSIFLTLFAFDRIGAGYPTNPITDDSQRRYLDDIGGILTDNTVTSGIVREMLALEPDKVRVHHQPALNPVPALRTGSRAYNNRYFSAANPFKVIWPHRLDKEKRPEVLVDIARRLREAELPAEIHVYGQQVLSDDGDLLMKSLATAGVHYHGPYAGGLVTLPTYDYHALLLTSESEGLPLVLVQSMLLGLPVIASAVGGVVDVVRDGETGILAKGPEDIDGFVGGIRRLMESMDDRRRIIHAGYELAVAQHGWTTFTRLVDQLG